MLVGFLCMESGAVLDSGIFLYCRGARDPLVLSGPTIFFQYHHAKVPSISDGGRFSLYKFPGRWLTFRSRPDLGGILLALIPIPLTSDGCGSPGCFGYREEVMALRVWGSRDEVKAW